MKDSLVPILMLAGVVYLLKDKLFGAGTAGGDQGIDPLLTPESPNYTTKWQRDRERYQTTITVLPATVVKANPQGVSDAEQWQMTTGITGNEQLIRASYEWAWANKLPNITLTVDDWHALRDQYIARFGGTVSRPNLIDVSDSPANYNFKRYRANEYLGMIDRYELAHVMSGVAGCNGGMGCVGCAGGCGCGARDTGGWLQ